MVLTGSPPLREKIWHWQFEENPCVSPFGPIVLLREDRVAGFSGIMSVNVRCNGVRTLGLWSRDFYRDCAYRFKGPGTQIRNALMHKTGLIASFCISHLAAFVLLQSGWHSSAAMDDCRKIRNWLAGTAT